jgi:hypothetical protein
MMPKVGTKTQAEYHQNLLKLTASDGFPSMKKMSELVLRGISI